MKKVKITVVIEYDETNIEAVQFVKTFESLSEDSDAEVDEDGFAIRSSMVEEL